MRRRFAILLAVASLATGVAAGAIVVTAADDDDQNAAEPTTTAPVTTVAAADGPDTTEPAPGSTAAGPDSTATPVTTTGGQAPTVATAGSSTGCVMNTADRPTLVAFCDTFDTPAGSPKSRAGDLDPVIWGVSRTNSEVNPGQGAFNDWRPATLEGCGEDQMVLPPTDVRICNGRLHDAVSDGGGQPIVAMYPKQPFNFADRTGTVVFDVSANSEGTHMAWAEFWITDQPVPAPRAGSLAAQAPHARHSVGFSIAQDCGDDQTGVDFMAVTRSYVEAQIPFERTGCVAKGALDALNHFEVRISQERVEVWASDPGSTDVQMIAVAENANLSFTQGLVWLNDVHYNACKEPGTQCDHTLAWDNLGWDGPAPYRDLSFDVPDANVALGGGRAQLGYEVLEPRPFNVNGVYWEQTPTGAIATFNWFPFTNAVPRVRLNGGNWIDTPWPFNAETYSWRTIAVPVPVEDVRTGTNTLELAYPDGGTTVSNINVILVAGAPAPAPVPLSS